MQYDPDGLAFPKLKRAGDRMPRTTFMAEEKLDGESLMLIEGGAFGRRISEVTGHRENKWGAMPPWVQRLALLNTMVHGELHVLDGTSSDVKTALVEGRETGWTGDLCRRLRFTAHTCYRTPGSSDQHLAFLKSRGFDVPRVLVLDSYEDGHWAMASAWRVARVPALRDVPFEHLLDIARRERLEGFVLKELGPDRGGWWKLKVTWTYDCVVVGTKDGAGQFYGDVGALIVGVFGLDKDHPIEVASVSGMTEVERKWMTEHRDELVGRVCEVEANGVASQGRLHHPRFVRWRDDKSAHECTIDQLERS